jgi:hypothetical protein
MGFHEGSGCSFIDATHGCVTSLYELLYLVFFLISCCYWISVFAAKRSSVPDRQRVSLRGAWSGLEATYHLTPLMDEELENFRLFEVAVSGCQTN